MNQQQQENQNFVKIKEKQPADLTEPSKESLSAQVLFEIPRQNENDEDTEAEVFQFKAPQKLLIPTKEKLKDNSNNDIFALVFKRSEKQGINELLIPDKITVPRTKGKHMFVFSTTEEIDIKNLYKDDLTPWKGNPHLRNYVVTFDNDNFKALESKSSHIETQAQCYTATHVNYSIAGNKITKKVYSATTPARRTPLSNTLIVIVYEIENDIVPLNLISPGPSSKILKKRSINDTTNELIVKKPTIKTPNTTPKRNAHIKPPAILDPTSLFVQTAVPSPPPPMSSETAAFSSFRKKIFGLEESLKTLTKELDSTTEKSQKRKEKLVKLQAEMYNLNKKLERLQQSSVDKEEQLKAKFENLQDELEKTNSDFIIELEKAAEQRKSDAEQIKILQNENTTLKNLIEEQKMSKGTVAELKINGKYKPEVQLAISELQTTAGIRDKSVGKAIKIICNMLGFEPNAVPSPRTVAHNSFFQKAINLEQLREVMNKIAASKIPFTVSTDESIRNAEILHNYILHTVDDSNAARAYVYGTLKGLDKSTSTIMKLMQKIVNQLESEEGCRYWEIFIMNLGNTMTDQASTNTCLIKELVKKKEAFYETIEDWDNLTPEEQAALTKINSFFCQLHILQNMTPVAVNGLLEHEKCYTNNNQLKQPLIFVLLQELARFLGGRAASKYDVAKKWRAFVQHYDIKFATIPDFKGHRFNILFSIAAAVFYNYDDILKFYDEHKTQMHDAKIDIAAAMKDPLVLSQLHLLAALNTFVTGPLTRLTENSPTINSLSEHATSLVNFLEKVVEEPMELLYGYAPFEDFEEAEEVTAQSKAHLQNLDLVAPMYPEIIVDAIEYVCEDLLEYCKKKFASFLPGGEHYSTTSDLRSVPRSNRRCESIFGLLGSDYSVAPRKRIARRDIKAQTIVNKSIEWLYAKPSEERDNIIKQAMKMACKLEADAAEDEKAYGIALYDQMLKQKEIDKKAASIKTRNAQEALNKVRVHGGIWKSIEQMTNTLDPMSETKQRIAITNQLRCHKLVLQTQPSNSPLFKITSNRLKNDTATLMRNLTSLIFMVQANEENYVEEDDEN